MKILYLHQYFATPEVAGGTRSFEMARRLVAKGHQVVMVTTSAMLSSKYDFSAGWNELEIEGIQLHVFHQSYSNKDAYLKRILKFIEFAFASSKKALSIKADVVFATSTPLTIAIPALIYKKLRKVPMVFEVRDLWPELPVAVGAISNPVFIYLAKWLERYTYKNSARVVGLSPGMCEGVIAENQLPEHVACIPNSCDVSLFHVPVSVGEEYKKRALAFVGVRKLVVYTGTFGVINKVGYLVELAQAMQSIDENVCFLAVGDGMEKSQVLSRAEETGVLNENLYFLDPVPKREVVSILSAADMALSLFGPVKEMWHNSANKMFDALASSTPPAINYGGWQKEFIKESGCGLVLSRDDYSGAATAISEFLSDDVRYKQAVNACQSLAREDFSRDRLASKLEAVLLDATLENAK